VLAWVISGGRTPAGRDLRSSRAAEPQSPRWFCLFNGVGVGMGVPGLGVARLFLWCFSPFPRIAVLARCPRRSARVSAVAHVGARIGRSHPPGPACFGCDFSVWICPHITSTPPSPLRRACMDSCLAWFCPLAIRHYC
jgi:hypothetical protein